jgi:superfamily II DNA or RNA helicase
MLELRPYQQKAIEKIESEWESGNRRTLYVAGTGTGKTIVMSGLVHRIASRGGRTLILAHRGELLDQAADKIQAMTGLA